MIDRLEKDDYLSITLFDDQSYTVQNLKKVSEINMKELKQKISMIATKGGTNFQKGYLGALKMFQNEIVDLNDEEKI